MKKFAVVLAGCGVFDGAEIHEATLTMLSILQQGANYEIFAPDINQHHVVNHLTGKEMPETRNVLVESARIARGKIGTLSDLKIDAFDALILPGGFGVAKNLCDFAFKGPDCQINSQLEKIISTFHKAGKPIGALCISPVILSKIFGNVKVTIGQDKNTIKGIEKMGSVHITTTHGEVVHDEENNLFTTPCYMLDATIVQIYEGTQQIVAAMLKSMG